MLMLMVDLASEELVPACAGAAAGWPCGEVGWPSGEVAGAAAGWLCGEVGWPCGEVAGPAALDSIGSAPFAAPDAA